MKGKHPSVVRNLAHDQQHSAYFETKFQLTGAKVRTQCEAGAGGTDQLFLCPSGDRERNRPDIPPVQT